MATVGEKGLYDMHTLIFNWPIFSWKGLYCLPTAIWDLSLSSYFCSRLKTELFGRVFGVNLP